jgi:UPF0716 protein FxsA
MRRNVPLAVLVALFVIVPIVEIYVIIQVGQAIGAVPTLLLLIAESLIGAWLVKHEGRRAWQALRETLQTGRLPGRELADAALILIGGTLLLTPGFVTDVFGFFFVLPFTRPLARRLLLWEAGRRVSLRMRQTYSDDVGGAYRIYRDDDPYR